MNLDSNSCKEIREKLLEFALTRQAWDDPPPVTEHLAECQSCRRYGEGLQLVPGLFSATGLYSARLRERTLRRLLQPETTRHGYSLPILVGISLLGFCLHFLLPAWILARLVEPLLASSVLAWATALMTVVSFGTISLLACAAALFRKRMGCSTSGILEVPQ